jgi:hypothetical protein
MAHRWEHDTPKQLADIGGEPIVHRTVRQLNRQDMLGHVFVAVRADHDEHGWLPVDARRAAVVDAKLDPSRQQADKLLSTSHLWNRTGRTVVLFGDVRFTDEAIATVVTARQSWCAFVRPGASSVTGKGYAELFGFAFDAHEYDTILRAALRCVRLADRGLLRSWSGGWQIFAAALDLPDDVVCASGRVGELVTFAGDRAVMIDDATDDVDTLADLERLRSVVATIEKS